MKKHSRLQERFNAEISDEMMRVLGYKNRLEVPRLEKVVINVGMGEAAQDPKLMEAAQKEVAMITGQKPIITRAKKAIANFKIRRGSIVGCKVTLRKAMMYEFLDRMISVAYQGSGISGVCPRVHSIIPEITLSAYRNRRYSPRSTWIRS